jgi:hypothetical protein
MGGLPLLGLLLAQGDNNPAAAIRREGERKERDRAPHQQPQGRRPGLLIWTLQVAGTTAGAPNAFGAGWGASGTAMVALSMTGWAAHRSSRTSGKKRWGNSSDRLN